MTRWPAVLLVAAIAIGLTGCAFRATSVDDIVSTLSSLDGVESAQGQTLTGNPDRPSVVSIYATLAKDATASQTAKLASTWQDAAQRTHNPNVELIVSRPATAAHVATLAIESDTNTRIATAAREWFAVSRSAAVATTVLATTVDNVVREPAGDITALATATRDTVKGSSSGWRLTASGVSVHAVSGVPDAASVALAASVSSALAPRITATDRTIDVTAARTPDVAVDLTPRGVEPASVPDAAADAAFRAVLAAVPIATVGRIDFTMFSRDVASLSSSGCRSDGPQAAALWAAWGGPDYCS